MSELTPMAQVRSLHLLLPIERLPYFKLSGSWVIVQPSLMIAFFTQPALD